MRGVGNLTRAAYAKSAYDVSKKVVKGKYLRIGRDSKTNRTDWFHLNKVIIYG